MSPACEVPSPHGMLASRLQRRLQVLALACLTFCQDDQGHDEAGRAGRAHGQGSNPGCRERTRSIAKDAPAHGRSRQGAERLGPAV